MIIKVSSVILSAALIVAVTGCSRVEKEKTDAAEPAVSDERRAGDFMFKTAESCLVNLEQTRIAMEKSSVNELRTISSEVNVQQKSLFDELKELASLKNIDLPDSLSPSMRRRLTSLATSKEDLDRKVLRRISSTLRDEVKAFKEMEKTSDGDIKAFITKNRPVIEANIDSLRVLRVALFPSADSARTKKISIRK